MESGNFQEFAEKKGFEIAYALFRLSTVVPHRDYKERLQKSALSLLECSSLCEETQFSRELSLAAKYMHIGEEMGLVSHAHAELVRSEIAKLSSAFSKSVQNGKLPDLDIAGIFSNDDVLKGEPQGNLPVAPAIEELTHEEDGTVIADENDEEIGGGGVKAAMRQSAILEKIRQLGNCRIKDLQDLFPDVSERTLRYDLQELIGQGLIERVGSGGPGVFYRMRVFEI